MNWLIRIAKNAKKSVKRFPANDQRRILAVLEKFADDPWSGDIAKIEEENNSWRKRVGNYRIFYSIQINTKTIDVEKIERRTSNTY